jgi:putative transposase
VDYLVEEHKVSLSRACRVVALQRSVYYYKSRKDDTPLMDKLSEWAELKPTEGFWKLYGRIRNQGLCWNHKRLHRVYKTMGLNIRRKARKRLPARVRQPLQVPEGLNQSWSMDFMSDSLLSGRKFRTLNLIDDYNREALAVEVDTALPAERVIRALEEAVDFRGSAPRQIRVDNGPEFISAKLTGWCERMGIELLYIQPGKPMQNGYIERFNGSFRKDVLDAYLFEDLGQVRVLTEQWVQDYNCSRPHDSLGGLSPLEYTRAQGQALTVDNSCGVTHN